MPFDWQASFWCERCGQNVIRLHDQELHIYCGSCHKNKQKCPAHRLDAQHYIPEHKTEQCDPEKKADLAEVERAVKAEFDASAVQVVRRDHRTGIRSATPSDPVGVFAHCGGFLLILKSVVECWK